MVFGWVWLGFFVVWLGLVVCLVVGICLFVGWFV